MSTYYETDDELLAEADKRRRIQTLNDELRSQVTYRGLALGDNELVVTRGLSEHGTEFIDRALTAVREFSDFSEHNDPYGEHEFGAFELDGLKLNWKIDYYDRWLCWGSPDPADDAVTRRVLTLMLADES